VRAKEGKEGLWLTINGLRRKSAKNGTRGRSSKGREARDPLQLITPQNNISAEKNIATGFYYLLHIVPRIYYEILC